jgi:hypothetical protein
MKISNNVRNFIKIAFLFFILFSTFYVYYLFNNEFKISEGFTGAIDCSDCKVQPNSGNCIPIYDISYKVVAASGRPDLLSISYELTPYVFCEWQPSPICISNNINNLPSVNERLGYTNTQIQNAQSQLNNITCCSGSLNNSFNVNYSISYEAVKTNNNNMDKCKSLDNYLNTKFRNNSSESKIVFDEKTYVDLQQLQINVDYRLAKTLCNDLSSNNYKRGLVFKKSDNSINIFDVPTILPKDLIDFIMNSDFSSRLPLTEASYNTSFAERNNINSHLQLLNYLNDQLVSRQNLQSNLSRRVGYADLTTLEQNRYKEAKLDLKRIFTRYNIPSSNYLDISYNLTKADLVTSPYILNPNEFFNCFGEIKQSTTNQMFSASNLLELSNNDYFGTGRDSSYSAYGSILSDTYPITNDLEMELARLELIPSSGNAPVSVINTYLNAINNFYEKQIANLTGPRDHVFNQELVFDNNTLETVTPTFFTYDNKPNNSYQCQQSVTGNSIFKDCGPAAYNKFIDF